MSLRTYCSAGPQILQYGRYAQPLQLYSQKRYYKGESRVLTAKLCTRT